MEWNRRKLESSIVVLERLREDKTIYDTEGIKIAGAYWEPIKNDVRPIYQEVELGKMMKSMTGVFKYCFLTR